MYVVATCGVFIVGVKCNVCTTGCTLADIKKEFIPHCKKITRWQLRKLSERSPKGLFFLFYHFSTLAD